MVYIPTNKYSGITFSQFVKEFIMNGSFDCGNEVAAVFMSILKYINANGNASPEDIKNIIEKSRQTPAVSQPQPMLQQIPQPQPVQPNQPVPPNPKQEKHPKKWPFGGRKAKNDSLAGSVIGNMNIPGMIPQELQRTSAEQGPAKPGLFGKGQRQEAPAPIPPSSPNNESPMEIVLEESPETILIKKYKTPAAGTGTPYLVAKNGERIRITRSGFTVGRENTSGINNDYTIKSPSVGRNHAMFEIKNGKYYVIDMTSLNGTFVNGTQIAGNIETEIRSGDVIAFAESEFRFVVE